MNHELTRFPATAAAGSFFSSHGDPRLYESALREAGMVVVRP